MAALSLPHNPGERISQILPTVKCSSCNLPVSLADLGDHVCPPQTPSTPRPSAILAKIRQASQSISISNNNNPNPNLNANENGNNGGDRSSRSTLGMSFRRSKTPQPTPSKPSVAPPPKSATPGPGMFSRARSSSFSRRSQQQIKLQMQMPPPDQMSPPLPSAHSSGPRLESTPMRVGTPQTPSTGPPAGRFDTLPRSFSPGTGTGPGSRRPSVTSVRDSRMRAPSAPETTYTNGNLPPGVVQQNGNGNMGMSRSAPGPMAPPSRPSMDGGGPPRMSMDRPGSTRPSLDTRPSYDSARVPSPLSPAAQRTPQSPFGPPRAFGTPVNGGGGGNAGGGGEVNMAGVGRRGFQAVAQAALLASSLNMNMQANQNQQRAEDRMRAPVLGMDGRRMNAPRHLNIDSNVLHPSSSSLSPNTPVSSHSPHSPSPHSPNFPQPGIVSSRTPSPSGIPFAGTSPRSSHTITPGDARSVSPAGSHFSARFNSKELEIDTAKPVTPASPVIPSSPSESDYSGTGLAYDQETESALSPLSPPPESISTTKPDKSERILFPSLDDPDSPQNSVIGLPTRSASSASAYSYASRTTAKSTEPPLPTLPLSPGPRSPKLPTRSRTTPAMGSKGEGKEAKRRQRQCTRCTKTIEDGRWVRAEGAGVLCERCWKTMYLPKCRRCNRPIEKQAVSSADGQLKGKYHRECFNCHKCQQPFPDKEFYVFDGKPFCRYHYHEANDSLCADPSCGQPIEGACAVAHTGERYHPEHLICEFRFSASIDSLASLTGATGGKTRCTERLEEYWEVDGLMLCEKHANMKMEMDIMAPDEDDEDDVLADLVNSVGALRMASSNRDSDQDVRAHRRKTQFIDLR